MSKDKYVFRNIFPFAFALALIFSFSAGAQSESVFYDWTAPAAENQLAADSTELASGQGAIFVPAMTRGADEPEVLVFSGERKAASGRTGERIPVTAGSYTVRVGSGAVKQMSEHQVEVTAGKTVTINPTWAGLKIEVVDTQNIPHRGTYELIRSEDREVFGIGYGADTLQGESLQVWLLDPGLYRVVRTGETYRARKDFATVLLPEGRMVHYKLVIDPETGDFRGSGVVAPEDMGVKTAESTTHWTHRATLSGAANLSSTDNFVGRPNQSTLGGTAFLDVYSTYENGPHHFAGIFELEEGFLQVDPDQGRKLPTQQTQDRLRLDGLYTKFVNERWGPYVRVGLLTNVFPAETLATDPIDVAFNRLDGSRQVISVGANDQYRTADGFGSLRLREGVGINVRLFKNQNATVSWRAGLGLRQNQFDNTFVEADLPGTPELDFFELDNFTQEGVETTLLANVRLTHRLFYITDLEVFADVDDTGNPTIDWRNTVSWRLSRFLSLDYTFDLLDFPQISNETQTRQNVLLRVSFDLL